MKLRLDIENKILIPFLGISVLAILCFSVILYMNSYRLKMEQECGTAAMLIRHVQEDIDTLYGLAGEELLLAKYRTYHNPNLALFDRAGNPILDRQPTPLSGEILRESSENRLGWRVCYIIDRGQVRASLIEEQKYMMVAAIVLTIVSTMASILIAYNISSPIRKLSETCKDISEHLDRPAGKIGCTGRKDEIGQLAVAFESMLNNINAHTVELRRVKQLNESILENLPIGVVAYDESLAVIWINSMANNLLAREEFTDGDRTLRSILDQIPGNDKVLQDPIRLYNAEGRTLDLEIGAWRLRSPDGAQWGTLCTIDDITYKKMMEEKLTEGEKLAYTGRLAAVLAHEIRNPLAGIRASIQVIRCRLMSERDVLLCSSMMGEIDRVNLLIENLLNLSRRRESQKTLLRIGDLFEELLLLYSKIAENNNIRIRAQTQEDVFVYADEAELKQVLINLINNSIRAISPSGEILLTARAGGKGIELTVADNGAGMNEETLRGIRARISSGRSDGGLGLSIAARLLAQNGGELTIKSIPGEGTRITILFKHQGGGHEA